MTTTNNHPSKCDNCGYRSARRMTDFEKQTEIRVCNRCGQRETIKLKPEVCNENTAI